MAERTMPRPHLHVIVVLVKSCLSRRQLIIILTGNDTSHAATFNDYISSTAALLYTTVIPVHLWHRYFVSRVVGHQSCIPLASSFFLVFHLFDLRRARPYLQVILLHHNLYSSSTFHFMCRVYLMSYVDLDSALCTLFTGKFEKAN